MLWQDWIDSRGKQMVKKIKNANVILGPIDEFTLHVPDLAGYSSVFLLIDENTRACCLPLITEILPPNHTLIEIKSGEENKTLRSCEDVWKAMLENGADRKSVLIDLGGGVIGDLGGFCAATYMRGIDFIQIPTTVLAMADASVGGKVGVDFQNAKNYIGVFQQPKVVWIDPAFILTLPQRHVQNGLAEILKHAFIADPSILDHLAENGSSIDWLALLTESVQIKSHIVERDAFEANERKKLNFGHTIGHAVESIFLDSEEDLLHGEAVVIGMITASYISNAQTGLSDAELDQIVKLLVNRYGKVDLTKIDPALVLRKIAMDKKSVGGKAGFTLLERLGEAIVNQQVDDALVLKSIEYYHHL